MNKAIELRATRKDTGETFEVLCIDFMHNSIFLDGHTIEVDIDSVIIEQFTGLLDCKGVKIFEGDRVSIFDTDDDEFMMCGVIKFGIRGYPAFDIYDDKNSPYSDDYNTLTNDEDFRFLVIGNIHQNSELLK